MTKTVSLNGDKKSQTIDLDFESTGNPNKEPKLGGKATIIVTVEVAPNEALREEISGLDVIATKFDKEQGRLVLVLDVPKDNKILTVPGQPPQFVWTQTVQKREGNEIHQRVTNVAAELRGEPGVTGKTGGGNIL